MKKIKIILISLGILVLLIILGVLFGNWYLKKEIRAELDKNEYSENFSYEDLSVNLLTQNASLSRPVWESEKFLFEAEDIQLKNFNIWNYLSNDIIEVDELFLLNPGIVLYDNIEEEEESNGKEMQEDIRIGKLTIVKGRLEMKDNPEADNELYLSILSLKLAGIQINRSTTQSKIPFEHEELRLEADSLFYDLNSEHSLGIKNILLDDGQLRLEDLNIRPKYSKADHDRAIPYEKDRASVSINSVIFKQPEWEHKNDSLYISSPGVEISGADAQIYRNKLLPDDPRVKPMYSEMIRELGIKVKLDSVNIRESNIVYEERTREENPAGAINFGNVEATIKNIVNVNMDSDDFPLTSIEARANFMGQSRVTLNWEFDIRNLQDEFQINGSFAGIDAEEINPFMRPVMNVETEGHIESLFYNFYGNRHEASGDMKLSYRDFKISLLKDGEKEEKSFLSGLVNLILKNDVVNEDVSQEDINVERDKTKSVWNFFWLLIREGSIKTFL
ncbi:hypothetical protein FHG64_12200 [Antarcticibacterium flavum]|uniref:DUF748 domain-containing protein n=1 Tax=Antarcticibacterium flavum TaxID=2058175 RepID=A0A5B7X5W7_9FLAO|nr:MULTISPECIES: hypothetical protein [Antarcticibacterium]MCM4158337.1 hypothetical protein [Antarcticibacterium sp. W02-3]QCY70101.1 hypothetical protein FHG64_12200 [Antarcticibacterium flavum]